MRASLLDRRAGPFKNLFANSLVTSLDGFDAAASQSVLSHTGSAVRWDIITAAATACTMAIPAQMGDRGRLLIRARANRALTAWVRVRASEVRADLTSEWAWLDGGLITAGAGEWKQSGILLRSGHVAGDWVEADRVMYTDGPSSGFVAGVGYPDSLSLSLS